MAKVTLYFLPYSEDDADGLRIQESADGLTGWTLVEDVGSGPIGTFPEYISSYTTSLATSTLLFFRIAWLVSGAPQGFSNPVQVGDLPPRYTATDIIQKDTQYLAIQTASDIYINQLIDTAYFMLQDECGPFDETDPGFIERAPLAMLRLVEYLFVRLDPALASASVGIVEEKIGSYKYKLADNATELVTELMVPDHLSAMVCQFGTNEERFVETISEDVFLQGVWFAAEEDFLDRRNIFVEGDADPVGPTPPVRKTNPD